MPPFTHLHTTAVLLTHELLHAALPDGLQLRIVRLRTKMGGHRASIDKWQMKLVC